MTGTPCRHNPTMKGVAMGRSESLFSEYFPANDACAYGAVQRVLGPALRDLTGFIGVRDYGIAHPVNLIAEYQAKAIAARGIEVVQGLAGGRLLNCDYPVAIGLQM